MARLEVTPQKRNLEPRYDYVLDDDHMAVLDLHREIGHDANLAGRAVAAGIGGEADEVGGDVAGDRAHEVGHEEEGALEHADEHRSLPGVIARDLLPQLADARPQLGLADEHAAGARRRHVSAS